MGFSGSLDIAEEKIWKVDDLEHIAIELIQNKTQQI